MRCAYSHDVRARKSTPARFCAETEPEWIDHMVNGIKQNSRPKSAEAESRAVKRARRSVGRTPPVGVSTARRGQTREGQRPHIEV